jgi:hypothetical protein
VADVKEEDNQWGTLKATTKYTDGTIFSDCAESRERQHGRQDDQRPKSQSTASSRYAKPALLNESHYGEIFLLTLI